MNQLGQLPFTATPPGTLSDPQVRAHLHLFQWNIYFRLIRARLTRLRGAVGPRWRRA